MLSTKSKRQSTDSADAFGWFHLLAMVQRSALVFDGSKALSKSRPFTIYLLKSGYDPFNSLKEAHKLDNSVRADALPEGAHLFVLDGPPTDVWWTGYFGVHAKIKQSSKGAIVFLPLDTRWFALSFGHVHQNLRDECFEHDFGLRVTLNCVDPKKLRSTDTVQPSEARRQRTQSPIGSDLTYFDFDRNSAVLRSLTGKVADKYQFLFKDATGASSLSIKSSASPEALQTLCRSLLELYQSEEYRKTFTDIQNIIPVNDPADLVELGAALVNAVRTKEDGLYLSIPDIIDYQKDAYYASFSGAGKSLMYPDVYLDVYYEYLNLNEFDLTLITLDDLRKHGLNLVDEDNNLRERFSILNSLIFETSLGKQEQTYHLTDGKWYRVENSYLARIRNALDPLCVDLSLPAFAHEDEGEYNRAVVASAENFLCLDMTNISPDGQSQIEPCDFYTVRDRASIFYHIKRSTHSSQLSHLFNQGMNSIEVLKTETQSIQKLIALIEGAADSTQAAEAFCEPLNEHAFAVIYGIITHKDPRAKSLNLPLFSRISLMRSVRWLQVAETSCKFGFIADSSGKKEGVTKKRKRRLVESTPEEELAEN